MQQYFIILCAFESSVTYKTEFKATETTVRETHFILTFFLHCY